MASVDLVPVTMNITCKQGHQQTFQSTAVQNFAGAAIDLSGWTALTARAVPAVAGIATADATFGTVTANASGIVKLVFATTDLSSSQPGTANLVISGKPTGGDPDQLLCSGIITLQGG